MAGGVPEKPAFVLRRIPKKDALCSMRLQLLSVIFLDMHIACATKNSKVRDIWLGLVPELIRSGMLDCCSRGAVVDMHKCSCS